MQVNANILHDLGTFELKDGKVAKAFLMKSDTIYDDWAESIRYRLWVRGPRRLYQLNPN